MKLKCDPVAFFNVPVIQGIFFSEPAHPTFIVMAMLAIPGAFSKDLFDMRWRMFYIVSMFIDIIKEKP